MRHQLIRCIKGGLWVVGHQGADGFGSTDTDSEYRVGSQPEGEGCELRHVASVVEEEGSHCRPLAFVLTPGQAGDAPAFVQVMSRLRVPGRTGRPRIIPDVVLADMAYSSRAIRRHLRRCGIQAVIPQPTDQAANRQRLGRLGGRPPAFDREAYKQRNTVSPPSSSGQPGDPKETA